MTERQSRHEAKGDYHVPKIGTKRMFLLSSEEPEAKVQNELKWGHSQIDSKYILHEQ